MRKLRPTLVDADEPGLDYNTTYFRVLEATASVRRLIHGKLRFRGQVCAIGSYFEQSDQPINSRAIDEIAAYNDSFPKLTDHERWKKVRRWLKFKVKTLR